MTAHIIDPTKNPETLARMKAYVVKMQNDGLTAGEVRDKITAGMRDIAKRENLELDNTNLQQAISTLLY